MEKYSENKRLESKREELVHEVFSWSLPDVLNKNLYNGKVAYIPKTFTSVSNYTKSFIYPLFEETRTDLHSKILGVSRSPAAEVVNVKKSKDFRPPKGLLYEIDLKRHKGSYEPEVGDLIAFTDVKPKCVDDLKRPNMSYIIALVQGMKKSKSFFTLSVLSSKLISSSDYSGRYVKLFAVYLTNLTTNIRISQALHLDLEGDRKKMIEKLLRVDSSFEESCAECFIDKTRDILLSKVKESLKRLELNSSQEAAVLSCVASRGCRHQNTIKIIWGPPGTGKTKTVSSLLLTLLRTKNRTLTCAPTNIAVLGVTKQVMSLVRGALVYNTYGLGDIVLFGNGERMKIDDCIDLSDVFLNLRVDILAGCLAPISGWKGSGEWMIRFLEDPEEQYRLFLKSKLSADDDDEKSVGKDDRGNNEEDGYYMNKSLKVDGESDEEEYESSLELDDSQDDLCIETEKTQLKALKTKNWKTFIVSSLKDEKEGRNIEEDDDENEPAQKPEKKSSEEYILTFEEFVSKGFGYLGNHLISCTESLYTHMPTSFISIERAKQMVDLVRSLKSLRESLKQAESMNVGLREALIGLDDARTGGLHACRMSCLEILKHLQETLDFPQFRDSYEIRKFCLENACLIFCTASSSINLLTKESRPLEFLVIDEASQLKECESVIPLQLDGIRHAILVGDERQLPAMVQSKMCVEADFGRSLFERLVSLGHTKHLLNVQYRMHPSISQFPNKEFYDKQILDGVNVKKSTYEKRFLQGSMYGSYSFINVTSAKEGFDKGHSMQNLMEVAVVSEIIASLFKEAVARKQRVSVGCISPYKAQVYAIQEKLGNKYAGSEIFSVNVKSVDGFQGSEEDIIIISTVRCNGKGSVGFLSNHQRANVALTRARYCLWIVGNGPTMINSGTIWNQLVVDAKDRGCFYNVNDDQNLAQAAMFASIELGQHDSLFNTDSLLFNEARWQVKFSDTFLETIARLNDHEISKKLVSIMIKLSSGWREPEKDGNTKVKIDGTCTILEKYEVTQDLCLIWAVDILAQNSVCIQVLKFWDVLPGTNIDKLVKILMEKVYGNYTMNMMNRCKEKRIEGNLTLPVSWPMNSDTDESWSLANQLAGLSLGNQPSSSSSSSRASSAWGFGNRKSNSYGDSRSHGRGPRW